MKMDYHHTIHLPRKLVWKWIKDEKVLQNAINGCKIFTKTSEDVYYCEWDLQFGPIKDVFRLEIEIIQEKMPSFYRLQVNGKGNLGDIQAVIDVFLRDQQGTTKIHLQADPVLTGTLAIVGQRVVNGGADKAITNFVERLEKEIKKAIFQARRGINKRS
ncbi:carbon monoxide dehydrogenase [Bacillus thermocopriae]|uniref:Carbon monoxide dehydrogenase n=2 Tax=Neobacillus thermocopriae TaxID=1215031 RepID=A0A6B3TT07_9BACI|nr:carbon monoxide dehydrogenase [Neobacillus thermocopriae]